MREDCNLKLQNFFFQDRKSAQQEHRTRDLVTERPAPLPPSHWALELKLGSYTAYQSEYTQKERRGRRKKESSTERKEEEIKGGEKGERKGKKG